MQAIILPYFLISVFFVVVAWIGTQNKSIKKVLAWSLLTSFVLSVLLSIQDFWPSRITIQDVYRYGKWWLLLIDFIPIFVASSILALSTSATSWKISVSLGKPKWVGISIAIAVALILLIPAAAGGGKLITTIMSDWP